MNAAAADDRRPADASVVAVDERWGTADVATLDHRDFRVVRPRHVEALRLLPE